MAPNGPDGLGAVGRESGPINSRGAGWATDRELGRGELRSSSMRATRLLLLLFTVGLMLPACGSTPARPSTRITAEIETSEAIAGARYVAYWLDFDLNTVRPAEAITPEEVDRLRSVAARLAAEADALENELEIATRERVAGRHDPFHDVAARKSRQLREKTIAVQAQWESFLALRDQLLEAPEPPTGLRS